MKRYEVGQVWKLGNGFVMVSSVSRGSARFGKAEKRGSSYGMVGTPRALSTKHEKD